MVGSTTSSSMPVGCTRETLPRRALTITFQLPEIRLTLDQGVGQTTDYQDDKFSESGELLEPDHRTIDINLKAAVNTTYLAIYYMKQQKHEANSTSSIVITASATGFQRFRVPDYAIAKHGAIGIMRGLEPTLYPALPIRINVLAPEFVDTGIINARLVEEAGSSADPPVVVAKAAVLLMADEKRHGQMIYTAEGKYQELEGRMNELVREIRGNRISLDHVMKYLLENTPK